MPPVVLWNRLTAERVRRPQAAVEAAAIRVANGADASDRAAVRSIAEACRQAEGGDAERFAAAGIAAELVSRPGRHVRGWLATPHDAAVPVGVVTLVVAGPPPGRCSIGWLLVHPSARRRGVATALVAEALDAAWVLGHESVCIETLAAWTDAVTFWHAMGFVARA